jgi:hypothetical protein
LFSWSNWPNWGGQDMQKGQTIYKQTCRKLGPGVLGTQMETHNSLVASFTSLYSASLLYLYSWRPYSFTVL